MNKILIDTNAYSHFLLGEPTILDILGRAEVIYMSTFVLGELLYGFKNGSKEKSNLVHLEKFLAKGPVSLLNNSFKTAEFYAMIKNNLKKMGRPIPINDVWIAAHAMESGSTLISRDQHFEAIAGLLFKSF